MGEAMTRLRSSSYGAAGPRTRPSRYGAVLAALLAGLVLPSVALAHRLDEYLQATLVAIEPGSIRLHIHLTPGVAVAGQVLALADRNHDGMISAEEAAAYAELLQHDLRVRLDRQRVQLRLAASDFPEPAELRTGSGVARIEFALKLSPLTAGSHTLAIENRHLPAISVYLLNAALPKSRAIRVTSQKRNDNQSVGAIEFTVQPEAKSDARN